MKAEKLFVWIIAVALFVLPRAAGETVEQLIVTGIAASIVLAVIVVIVYRWMGDR